MKPFITHALFKSCILTNRILFCLVVEHLVFHSVYASFKDCFFCGLHLSQHNIQLKLFSF